MRQHLSFTITPTTDSALESPSIACIAEWGNGFMIHNRNLLKHHPTAAVRIVSNIF